MAGMNARKVRNTPSRSVAIVSRQSASEISCSGAVGPAIPALATTARTGPSCPARPARAATEASSHTSQATGTAVPPAACDVCDEASVAALRSEEHTSELQSRRDLVCRLLLEKKINIIYIDG